jgi:hypothetical protein
MKPDPPVTIGQAGGHQIQVDNPTAALSSRSLDTLCAVITLDSPLDLPVPKPDACLTGREIYRVEPITIGLARLPP